jgi:hypothetical protein
MFILSYVNTNLKLTNYERLSQRNHIVSIPEFPKASASAG